ncbi:MAG: hypothetical protein Roseis2KO_31260 [Roseivirga sp.]
MTDFVKEALTAEKAMNKALQEAFRAAEAMKRALEKEKAKPSKKHNRPKVIIESDL